MGRSVTPDRIIVVRAARRWERSTGEEVGIGSLSVDYEGLVRRLSRPLDAAQVGAVLLEALAGRYMRQYPTCALHEFGQSGATYLFDLASAAGGSQEDRTVAAWTLTPSTVAKRDTVYQRGFPLPAGQEGAPVDRGHVIPHPIPAGIPTVVGSRLWPALRCSSCSVSCRPGRSEERVSRTCAFSRLREQVFRSTLARFRPQTGSQYGGRG